MTNNYRTRVLDSSTATGLALPETVSVAMAEIAADMREGLVQQEIWGHLCCHYAIRSLMVEAAEHRGHDPERVSFIAALPITRQTIAQPGAFPLTSTAATAPAGWSSSGVSRDESTPPAAAA